MLPPPPESEWVLGQGFTSEGRLLIRHLQVPEDVPSSEASLVLRETTSQPALTTFELPLFAERVVPVRLLAKPAEGDVEEAPPPPTKKGK